MLSRSNFGKVTDGNPGDINLSPEEQSIFDELTDDNNQTHSWDLLKETFLHEVGLSHVSEKGNSI